MLLFSIDTIRTKASAPSLWMTEKDNLTAMQKGSSAQLPPKIKRIFIEKYSFPKKPHITYRILFQCDKCDAAFTKSRDLEQHSGVHTGVKRFVCSECNNNFRTAQSLRRHREAYHPEAGQAMPCTVCGEVFNTK